MSAPRTASRGEVDVVVESLAPGGEGVVRTPEGRVAFVGGVIEGERVRVAFDAPGGRKPVARLVAVLSPSADRVDPSCPHARACGGCDWIHIARAGQPTRHARIVEELVARAIGVAPPPIASFAPAVAALRTRARFAVKFDRGAARVGYRARGSHALVAIDTCEVLEPGLLDAARLVVSWLERSRGEGELSVGFGLRDGTRKPVVDLTYGGDPSAAFFASADRACAGDGPLAGMTIALSGTKTPIVIGDPRIVQPGSDGEPLVIAAGGFAQASDAGSALLASRVRALASPEGLRVHELFSGSGTLSIALARGARAFSSVEENERAVACARENLRARGLDGTLRVGDAEAVPAPRGVDVLVLDPPRTGAPRATVAIADAKPKRVVYVSCDPATLARDLGTLHGRGFTLTTIETVELFPNTSHVETIAVVERGRPKAS
jgi:23S rRNA (uracil1939-C5)-methyltransferase